MRSVIAFAALMAATPVLAEQDNYIDFNRGKALATAGDCIACHTAPGGQPFAGGLALQTPFGAIMTPNLTPDDATGIGRWSKDNFARAMHEGRRPDGVYLYPAFPYPYYTKVTRQDVDAIYDYLRTLTPVSNTVNRRTLPFPFNIRTAMWGWNALYFTPGVFHARSRPLRGIQPRRLSGRRSRPLRRLPHAAQYVRRQQGRSVPERQSDR